MMVAPPSCGGEHAEETRPVSTPRLRLFCSSCHARCCHARCCHARCCHARCCHARCCHARCCHARCCGRDVHQKSGVACILLTDPDGTVQREVQTLGTLTADLLALNDGLSVRAVAQVARESTAVYWRPVLTLPVLTLPVLTLLEAEHEIILVNAQHRKAVPGRKTEVKDRGERR
jgi:hypothetical protein